MGLHSLWDGKTVPMRRMHVNVYGRPAGTVAMDTGASPFPAPMLVGQDVTEQILYAHLKTLGVPVERGTEATQVVLRADGVEVTIRLDGGQPETFQARWVVGCEGAHSLVRDAAGITTSVQHLNRIMVPIADGKVKWPLINQLGDCHTP